MSQPSKNDQPRPSAPSKNATEPDPTLKEAKENWEDEGGSAPGKLNQDHPIPGSAPASK